VPCSIPSRILTSVIFTCFQTSHVMYHMTNPDTQLPTPAFPLWITDMITKLRQLPNRDVGSTSYLGNTSVRNSRTQTTERHSDLTVTVSL